MAKTKEDAVRLADQARQLMLNEALAVALATLEKTAFDRFLGATNPEQAWLARCDYLARQDFITTLHTIVSQGEHAAYVERTNQDKLRERELTAKRLQKYNQQAAEARAKWAEAQRQALAPTDTEE